MINNGLLQILGYTHIALIVPSDLFTEIAVQNTIEAVPEQRIEPGYFDSMDAALEWIKR